MRSGLWGIADAHSLPQQLLAYALVRAAVLAAQRAGMTLSAQQAKPQNYVLHANSGSALWLTVLQGTLYPDVIESCPPPGSGQKHSHTIKSHHNVGGLPKDLQFKLIEPFRELFKDEVRRASTSSSSIEVVQAGPKQGLLDTFQKVSFTGACSAPCWQHIL